MTKIKTTKNALIVSVVVLILCVSVLISSTFAWFTDSASTSVNTILSGTLDIDLVDASGESLEGKTLDFIKASGAPAGEAILWEPGCTYDLSDVYVKNNGNLALKYKIEVTGVVGDAKLNEAIDWTVNNADASAEYHLTAGEMSEAITIRGHMKETAGNEYQGLSINGIAITVLATQDTVEYDSISNQYDAQAEYPAAPVIVANQTELADAIANVEAGEAASFALPTGTFTLPNAGSGSASKDITISGTKDTVIDVTTAVAVGGTDYTFEGVTVEFGNNNHTGIQHSGDVVYKDCTIKGKMTNYAEDVTFINCTFEHTADYCIWTYAAKNATFTDCTFNTGGKAILVYIESTNSSFVANINLNNCIFIDNGGINGKAAVEAASDGGNTATSNKYNINFTDCTVNGFDTNNSSSNYWGNKNSMDTDHLNVVIDGVDVY